jgi:uncharacterized membrane protein
MNNPDAAGNNAAENIESARNITLIVYILQSLFFLGWVPPVIGVIINHVKLEDVQHTWLASHFRWQIRTFWFGMLWLFIGSILFFAFFIGVPVLIANFIWFIYRIAKGFLRFLDGKPMYVPVSPMTVA